MILSTARLALREMTPDDLDFVAAMLGDAEVMRFYPKVHTRDEASAWLERQRSRYARDGHALWLVSERESGLPVGQVGLVTQVVGGEALPEIGYLIHRPYWRRGYASEAALGVRDHAFGVLRYARVISLIRAENEPSRGVARKMGMRISGETMHGGFRHDVWAVGRTREGS